ncbi:MazG-like family protein [Nonomuraea sp. NPDC050547]|uniref:MazG-like family protein n=1 Tax=Nonomuraea sp. NPDC050547 TaxID=3364368 RepID=UPI0037B4D7F3
MTRRQITLPQHVAALLSWLNTANPPTEHEIAMRIMKIGEEFGEVVAAYIGVTGQNPRKGVSATPAELTGELCDVIIAAMAALATVAGDVGQAERLLNEHLSARHPRLPALVSAGAA